MTTKIYSPLTIADANRSIQSKIRLPLPIVLGNCDYKDRERLLCRMNEVLLKSGIESSFIDCEVQKAETAQEGVKLTDRQRSHVHINAKKSLRCTIARILANESHRSFSCHLAESPLLQWFCGCDALVEIRVPSKSTLQRMESEVPVDVITTLNRLIIVSSTKDNKDDEQKIGLCVPVDLSTIWFDSTCAKLDIHYPADWTLLRDGTRSIMAAILVIRKHGLVKRMPDPKSFTAEMNGLAMEMSGASRRGRGGDKKRSRKRVLRAMKKMVKKVRQHGQRYRDALENSWKHTDLSLAQTRQIVSRLDSLLASIPIAVKQAHDRIIGERVIPNGDKMLSLYEQHAKVYVRGKAGADVEFGLQLLVCESVEGLIVDCLLRKSGIANDSTLLIPAIKRIRKAYGDTSASTVVGDRGFTSKKNAQELIDLKVIDANLPRSPKEMAEFLKLPGNRNLQRRRAQTEARIGVLKANFIGDHLPTKGFANQERFIAWAVLAHNLWVLSRLDQADAVLAKAS